jgi:hypothetical protein
VHVADQFYFRRLALVVIAAVMLLLAFVGFCKYSFFFPYCPENGHCFVCF